MRTLAEVVEAIGVRDVNKACRVATQAIGYTSTNILNIESVMILGTQTAQRKPDSRSIVSIWSQP